MQSALAPHRTRFGGLVLLLGAALFLALDGVAERTYVGFDPRHDPLSRLGETDAPTRLLWSAGLLILAAGWLVGVATVIRPRASGILMALNAIPVGGIFVAVLVPLDRNVPIHEVAAFAAFLGGIAAVLANAEILRPSWRIASSSLAGVAVLALSPVAGGLIGVIGWGGLERMVVFPLVAAIAVFGLAVLVGGEGGLRGRRSHRPATVGLLAVAIVVGILGLGTGLTKNGYQAVFGHSAIPARVLMPATLQTPPPARS